MSAKALDSEVVIAVSRNTRIADYEGAVRSAGGTVWIVGQGESVQHVLQHADGILLTGGADIDPVRYGASRHPLTQAADSGRDQFEIALAREAIERDIPLLGICRGMQVLNVAGGGTLLQDIPEALTPRVIHQMPQPLDALAHNVEIRPGARLFAYANDESGVLEMCLVNSRHHQALDRVADGLIATAFAPDGLVEGVEGRDARFCLGVQWHPENFWRSGRFKRLFEGLIDAARS